MYPVKLCFYYRAVVDRQNTWLFVGFLRSFDHMVFYRTHDPILGVFEFFVPEHFQQQFLDIMTQLQQRQLVYNIEKLPNRLAEADSTL